MRVVGLTGGIGSGKSTVARIFAALGAHVIDADQLAREVVEPGEPALRAIVERFGAGVLDASGQLDRRALGARVFADAADRRALEAIVHPAVRLRAMTRIQAAGEAGAPLVLYDVPLFFETGLERDLPEVIVVTTDPASQRARVAARDGLAADEIERRIAAQLPLDEKARRATWIIDNSGSPEATRARVEALFRELTEPAPVEGPR